MSGIRNALVLLLFASGAAAQEEPVDTVRLRFGWKPGTVAEVEARTSRERIAERTDSISSGGRYRMTVEAAPEGIRIRYDDFQVDTVGAPAEAAAVVQGVMQQVAGLIPEVVIAPDGAFHSVAGVETLRARLDTLFTSLLGSEEGGDQALSAIRGMFSEDALNLMAAQEWNTLVGTWVDADLEVGAVYEYEDEGQIPILPGATVPMITEFSVLRRLGCVDEDVGEDCVEIQAITYPDPEAMAELIERFLAQLAPAEAAAAGLAFEELEVETELLLVTEPATLLPHRATMIKSVSGAVRADEGESAFAQTDIRTYHYRYRQ